MVSAYGNNSIPSENSFESVMDELNRYEVECNEASLRDIQTIDFPGIYSEMRRLHDEIVSLQQESYRDVDFFKSLNRYKEDLNYIKTRYNEIKTRFNEINSENKSKIEKQIIHLDSGMAILKLMCSGFRWSEHLPCDPERDEEYPMGFNPVTTSNIVVPEPPADGSCLIM